ncbi:hypothetical protein QUF75_07615 [Desulfococcaceae bacterium HSG7]|nr:hypothetical protein [Desulfococcaceae bacterium HSG9]MDM8554582.1 hypothetical protein [Desulfococcaceae bacterium HSG7]
MQELKIKDDAFLILRAGLNLQRKLNDIKTEKYFQRLVKFEEKYDMKSDIFIRDFESGKLGDDADWFDWLFVWEAWNKSVEKSQIIESLSL